MVALEQRFQLMVLYEWRTGIGPERIAYHAAKIRGLPLKVPNLFEARFGARLLGHPADQTSQWHHAAVLVFRSQRDYAAFGTTPAHDEVAIELVADLERISYIGFEG